MYQAMIPQGMTASTHHDPAGFKASGALCLSAAWTVRKLLCRARAWVWYPPPWQGPQAMNSALADQMHISFMNISRASCGVQETTSLHPDLLSRRASHEREGKLLSLAAWRRLPQQLSRIQRGMIKECKVVSPCIASRQAYERFALSLQTLQHRPCPILLSSNCLIGALTQGKTL